MDIAFEDKIRQRAYEIWQAAGMRGDADQHWLSAETHLRAVEEMPARKPAAKTKAATAKVRAKSVAKPARSAKSISAGASANAF